MMKKLLLITVLLNLMAPAYGDYFDGFRCNQGVSAPQEMQLEHIDRSLALKWYKIDHTKAKFGDIESDAVNYLFWNDKFYGKVCAIVGKKNINKILRYFKQEVERIYEKQTENEVFKHPISRKDGSYVFIEPDKIIIVKRFSLHLGQVEILCRDLFEKLTGMPEEKGK